MDPRYLSTFTPARRDRENILIGVQNLKDNVSNRKHNYKKQAFGELNNIIHNNQNKTETEKKFGLKLSKQKVATSSINHKNILQENENIFKPKQQISKSKVELILNSKIEKIQHDDFEYDFACSVPKPETFKDLPVIWMNEICSKISDKLSIADLKHSQPKTVNDIQNIIDYEFGYENQILFEPTEILDDIENKSTYLDESYGVLKLNEIEDFNSFEMKSPKKLSLPKNNENKLSDNWDYLDIDNLDDLELPSLN